MKLIIVYNNESCSSYRNKKLADDSVIIRLLEGKELDHFKSEKTRFFYKKVNSHTTNTYQGVELQIFGCFS